MIETIGPSEVHLFYLRVETAAHPALLDAWTLKEAYIKARGRGLAIPLNQFSFHIRSIPS